MHTTSDGSEPRIIIVGGPTAAGKTGFAIGLARRFDGEIIGADSMQIYRLMDIGTAKPSPQEQAAVPHHMIDIVDPDEEFDAAAYAAMAGEAIRQVTARGHTAFVVGGTGFYIKALLYGLFDAQAADPEVRRQLQAEVDAIGPHALYRRLQAVDAPAAARIHPNDTYRIVRALEVFVATGQPLTVFQQRHGFRRPCFRSLEIGLTWPRERLYARINRRVDTMMDQGFMDEVRSLLNKGYQRSLKSMQSLGYRHLAAVIDDEYRLDEALATLKRDHRRYAKRQTTWFGARPSLIWLTPDQLDQASALIDAFLLG